MERSVFRTYQEDSPEFLESLLSQDIKYGKLNTLTKNDRDLAKITDVLSKHYHALKNIFLH